MSQPSGFVAISFQLAGKILVVCSAIVIVLYLLSIVVQWFAMPVLVLAIAMAAMLIGLYLIFIVPREDGPSN